MVPIDLEVEQMPVGVLVEYQRNAKVHTDEQISAVAESISQFGFRNPILVWRNEEGNPEIIAGHARLAAAKRLGMETVPVIRCDDLTDAQRRALTLADNQTTMMTGWDENLLYSELDSLIQDFDMCDFGFADSVGGEDVPAGNGYEYESQYALTITCDSEEDQRRKYDELVGMGYEVKVVVV